MRTDPDGALVFASSGVVSQLGDVIRKLTDGTFEYRFTDGTLLRFDSSRKLTALSDTNSNTTTFTCTGTNLTRVTDPVGRSIDLECDGNNRVIRVTDPLDREWTYSYDSNDMLVKVTDPLDFEIRYEYVNLWRLSKITDKRGNIAKQILYDPLGRVSEQRFAGGGLELYDYKMTSGRVTETSVTDSLGRIVKRRFNATSEHPLWVEGKGWLAAAELRAGDRLMTKDGRVVFNIFNVGR